jgi:two-component system, OmpR family, phosphate regulon sensor histidine kinase PhoR
MARSLVRFVFPQFAVRLVLVVIAMALGIFFFARAYRIELLLLQLQRDSVMVETVIAAPAGMAPPDVRLWFDRIADRTGVDLSLLSASGSIVYAPPRSDVAFLRTGTADAETTGLGRIRPAATGRRFIGVVRPIVLAEWPDARYLGISTAFTGLDEDLASLGGWLIVMVVVIFGAVLVISYRVVEGIKVPLRHLERAASRFADGDLAYRCVLPEPTEFNRLAETMNSMAAQLTARLESVRSHRSQLETILGSMIEGVILVDQHHHIRSINAAARRIFGIAGEEAANLEARTLLEVIRNSSIYELVQATLAEERPQEERIVIYGTPVRHMQMHGTALRIGDVPHALIVMNDITRLHELEQVRKEFVANVSHELKTPVTSIIGFVETLRDGALDDREDAERFLAIVANQAGRLNTIIEDLLQLSRLEQNHAAIPTSVVRAEELVARVRRTVETRATEKLITIKDFYRGSAEIRVAESLVEQAITNLVDNAIKYSPRGSTIAITFEARHGRLLIEVRDDGPGIPYEDQPRLFERFFRVDKARSRELGGTGLGLAIVKHIAQAHDGTVEVESRPGAGSAFRLIIPQ